MPKGSADQLLLSEHIFEARFAPTGAFLDVRGSVADYLAKALVLPHWRINENTINLNDSAEKADKLGAFVSFRNAGLFSYDPPTRNFFEDKAESFWKNLLAYKEFAIPKVSRVGVRTKTFLKLSAPFDNIREQLCSKLFANSFDEVMGGKATDVSATADLEVDGFKIKITVGPMHENEVGNFFSYESTHFESAGAYIDCDVYTDAPLDPIEVAKTIKSATRLAWAKADNYFAKIGY